MIATEPNVKGLTTWTLPDGEPGVGIQSAVMRANQVFVSGKLTGR